MVYFKSLTCLTRTITCIGLPVLGRTLSQLKVDVKTGCFCSLVAV